MPVWRLGEGRDAALSTAYARLCQLLLQAVAAHAVEADAAGLEAFRADLRRLQESLGRPPSAAEALTIAGAATRAIAEYNQRASRFLGARVGELQEMLGMLTDAISVIASGSERSVARLQQIERKVERAAKTESLQALKGQLGECLEALRQEVVEQKQHSTRAVQDLRERLSQIPSLASWAALDPLTGLPGRPQAEEHLRKALTEGQQFYVAVFVVDQIRAVNESFGYAAGNHMLKEFSEHLRARLGPADLLFRWSEAAFAALLDRREHADEVSSEMSRILSGRRDVCYQFQDRSVLLPIAAAVQVLPAGATSEELIRQTEEFVRRHAGTDHY